MPLLNNDNRFVFLSMLWNDLINVESSISKEYGRIGSLKRTFNEEETLSPIVLDTSLIQYLAFIACYCVHCIFKSDFILSGGITHSSCLSITEEVSSICSQRL